MSNWNHSGPWMCNVCGKRLDNQEWETFTTERAHERITKVRNNCWCHNCGSHVIITTTQRIVK